MKKLFEDKTYWQEVFDRDNLKMGASVAGEVILGTFALGSFCYIAMLLTYAFGK